MTKLRLAIAVVISLMLVGLVGLAALAEQEIPAPYAGMKNPFPWDDPTAKQAGQKVYQASCLGCHGARGDSLPVSDFSKTTYGDNLQNKPDLYFWVLSEGRMNKGMPQYKSSLSETQRWQVLTYIRSLPNQAPAATTPPSTPKPAAEAGTLLQLNAPKEARAGKTITLIASLHDAAGAPIPDAEVKFFANESFFAKGLMEIGDATTDSKGSARLDTALENSGDIQIIARYRTAEATVPLTLTPSNTPFYKTEVGIRLPTIGAEVLVGSVLSESLDNMGAAPGSVLRLPGGTLSWLLIAVMAVLLIWSTYFYVMYQVLHVAAGRNEAGNMKVFPSLVLVAVVIIGLSLALKLVVGPYSQFHLLP